MRRVGRVWALCVGLSLTFVYAPVLAQDRGKAESSKKKRKKRSGAKKPSAKHNKAPAQEAVEREANVSEADAREANEREPRSERAKKRERATKDDSAARAAAQAAADAEIVKEGDTTVKVMKFSGLSLEGRLKSPQLLYFVNRVHAEFDRPKLPHRSFMPELDRSTRKDPL
jgi:hypothetical protein